MDNVRISTNSVQESLVRQINLKQQTLVSLQEQLASGRKISKPEDDPVIFGRTIRRESVKAELAQYNTNNIVAQTIVSTSQLHIDGIRDLADLALGIANSTGDSTSAVELDGYQRQLDEILNQALDMANARLDGEYLIRWSRLFERSYHHR
jgi:flagellar hook-associated protein 3 FlgL